MNDDRRIDAFVKEKLEAPPGFEPGVEVLQCDSKVSQQAHFRKFTNNSYALDVMAMDSLPSFLIVTTTNSTTLILGPSSRLNRSQPNARAAKPKGMCSLFGLPAQLIGSQAGFNLVLERNVGP